MIDPDRQQSLSLRYQDPKLMDLDLRDWDEGHGDWLHKPSGASIGITGRAGKWVVQYPNGRLHKTAKGNRPSYFKTPSMAINVVMNNLKESRRTFMTIVQEAEWDNTLTTVYHITSDANLPAIRRDGLVPQLGSNSKQIGETVPAIHVFTNTDTLEDAIMNWSAMDWTDEDIDLSLITLRVPVNMITAPSHLTKGFQASQGIAEILEPIPPNMITNITELY